jgi:hypothetical protein
MDLATISKLTGLAPRRLWYVIEHKVLPDVSPIAKGRGVRREFDAREAFEVALAAFLFEAGLRRSLVKQCIDRLHQPHQARESNQKTKLLHFIFADPAVSHLEIADWANMRLIGRDSPDLSPHLARWTQIGTGARIEKSYEPMVTLRLALMLLRERLLHHNDGPSHS